MSSNPKKKDCVGDEMRRWKAGKLHSGVGKEGKKGPVVRNKDQAIAIALSVCGKSEYAEHLMSLGFSERSAHDAAEMLFKNPDWENQFTKGDTLSQLPRENKTTIAPSFPGFDIDNRPGKQPGAQGKHRRHHSQGLSAVALPKGNPQPGPRSRSDLKGLAMFEEGGMEGECNQKEKKEQSQQERTPEQQQADQQRSSDMTGEPVAPNADREASAQKAAETRKRCRETGGASTKSSQSQSVTRSPGAGTGAGSGAGSGASASGGAGGGAGSGAGGGAGPGAAG